MNIRISGLACSQKEDTTGREKRGARLKWLYIQIHLRIYMLRLELKVPEPAAGIPP